MKHLLIIFLSFALLSCKEDKEDEPTPQARILTPCDSTGYNYVVDVVFDDSKCVLVDLNSNVGINLAPDKVNQSLFIQTQPTRLYFPERPEFIRVIDCDDSVHIFRNLPDCYFKIDLD